MGGKSFNADIESTRPDLGAVRQLTGSTEAAELLFGLVASRFNAGLTHALVASVVDHLKARGAADSQIVVVWVPGAYEISAVIHKLAARRRFDVLIALGVVIQGETPHAGLINQQLGHALAEISRQQDVPVIDAVIAANTLEQAEVRCGAGPRGRGGYAAAAAIEMAHLFRRLKASVL
jgi:6,7-dimethyl-8-ribityllumazine synthase